MESNAGHSARISGQGTGIGSNHPGAVFVSYSSADVAVADTLVAALETAGIRCWIAPRDVKPGALYAEAIVRAIGGANVLVLVLSANSIVSAHVGKEVERASSKRRPLIAFRIDEAPLSPALEYFLSESHWINASACGKEVAIEKLIAAIREPEGLPPVTIVKATTSPSSDTAAAARPKSRTRPFIATGLALVTLTLAALLVDRWFGKHPNSMRPPASAPAGDDKSVAVLPFADLSEKKDQEYFGDGMAEEIIDLLATIPGIPVIGRTSSFQFKGKNVDLRMIGTQLNAAHVLEGSIRKSGDNIRITAELIDTRSGTHEWSETYDRQMGDVLKLQDAIAAAVVRELQLTVAPEQLSSRSTLKSTEAYDLYLRGRHAADRWDDQGLNEAITLFRQALVHDPTSSETTAQLADAYMWLAQGSVRPSEEFEQSRREASRALELDPKNVLAHVVMAHVHFIYDWNWAAAEREIQEAAKLESRNVNVLEGEAYLSEILGRWDDAYR